MNNLLPNVQRNEEQNDLRSNDDIMSIIFKNYLINDSIPNDPTINEFIANYMSELGRNNHINESSNVNIKQANTAAEKSTDNMGIINIDQAFFISSIQLMHSVNDMI